MPMLSTLSKPDILAEVKIYYVTSLFFNFFFKWERNYSAVNLNYLLQEISVKYKNKTKQKTPKFPLFKFVKMMAAC